MTTTPDQAPTPLPLAERCTLVKPSATAELFREVAELRAAGVPVTGLHVGEPDFGPPAHVIRAAQEALAQGATRYTPVRGIEPLRRAICEDSARRRAGVIHEIDQVVVSTGAKQALFNLALALFQPGDEVVIPSPCWVSYPDQVRLSGATPVVVDTARSDFKLTPDLLRGALGPRARGLVLCTPHNPTGAAYDAEELRALADVIAERALWVIVDEIYAELSYEGFRPSSLLEVAPELYDRTVIVDGVSKRFAMTGFRLGWLLAPTRVARACETFQSQSTTSAAAVSQHAALAALTGPQEEVAAMQRAFESRRARVLAALEGLADVACRPPEGAFYVFIDLRARLARPIDGRDITDDITFCRRLLERERIALVPGTAFGAPGYVRLSYAAADDELDAALATLRRWLS